MNVYECSMSRDLLGPYSYLYNSLCLDYKDMQKRGREGNVMEQLIDKYSNSPATQ